MTVYAWLEQEVRDLLDVGSVGLYELLELLRSSDFQIADAAMNSIAREVARDLVTSGQASVCLLRWPKDDVIDGPLAISVLDKDESWKRLFDDLYVALMPDQE